jgi:catechol 2,3-dioxygenase-like lactoylglutathione lyase family enzyme
MAVRYLVDDVDAALPFYRALGFRLADRWGPPFAVMKGKGLTLWLGGPGTSARKQLASGALPAPGGWNRIVVETKDLDAKLAKAVAAGGKAAQQTDQGAGRAPGVGRRSVGERGGGVRGQGRLSRRG